LAELARSFGRIASDYDMARPEYAPEAVDRAAEVLELGTDARHAPAAARRRLPVEDHDRALLGAPWLTSS
jgi:hypothetical protein